MLQQTPSWTNDHGVLLNTSFTSTLQLSLILEQVDLLSVRLFAINVMSGTLGFIHRKFVGEEFQFKKFKNKQNHDKFMAQMVESASGKVNASATSTEYDDKAFQEDLERLNMVKEDERRAREGRDHRAQDRVVVLWTKQQLNVLHQVLSRLHQKGSSGCRIIVQGGKGSGKTLIMKQIALLARHIPGFEKVVIGNGSGDGYCSIT